MLDVECMKTYICRHIHRLERHGDFLFYFIFSYSDLGIWDEKWNTENGDVCEESVTATDVSSLATLEYARFVPFCGKI